MEGPCLYLKKFYFNILETGQRFPKEIRRDLDLPFQDAEQYHRSLISIVMDTQVR